MAQHPFDGATYEQSASERALAALERENTYLRSKVHKLEYAVLHEEAEARDLAVHISALRNKHQKELVSARVDADITLRALVLAEALVRKAYDEFVMHAEDVPSKRDAAVAWHQRAQRLLAWLGDRGEDLSDIEEVF